MCDTLVALANATADGSVIFAKNSDRRPNEAHELVNLPAQDYPANSELHCTYRSIPQVEHTLGVFLAKPFWIWGAEMGGNEKGVVIGNEAVFTRAPYSKEPGLIGMDYLRLGLERGATAKAALEVIVELLDQYGQGGNCGFGDHPFFYHNSFLIADREEAWVLETVDRQWAAVKVKDVRTISNGLTIGKEWDLASEHVIDYAVKNRWVPKRQDFHFGLVYSDPMYTFFSDSARRQDCTQTFLEQNKGRIEPKMVMNLLRNHGEADHPEWNPDRSLIGNTVCMHSSYGPVRGDQSVGSLVTQLRPESITNWVTGTSAPCTSIFKPTRMDAGLPDLGPTPNGRYNPRSLFWRHERLHRAVMLDPTHRLDTFRAERDALEEQFIAEESARQAANPAAYLEFSASCFRRADEAEEAWLKKVTSLPVERPRTFYYRKAWRDANLEAGFPDPI